MKKWRMLALAIGTGVVLVLSGIVYFAVWVEPSRKANRIVERLSSNDSAVVQECLIELDKNEFKTLGTGQTKVAEKVREILTHSNEKGVLRLTIYLATERIPEWSPDALRDDERRAILERAMERYSKMDRISGFKLMKSDDGSYRTYSTLRSL